MKTITGKVLSLKMIPGVQALSFLLEFVNTDTGASQAVGAYLRRATSASDELLRVHSKSHRRQGGEANENDVEKRSFVDNGGFDGGGVNGEEGKDRVGDFRDDERKSVIEANGKDGFDDGKKVKQKKKKRERERVSVEENGSFVRDGEGGIKAETNGEGGDDVEERRLKRKNGGGDEEGVGTEKRNHSKKKKKRRKYGEDDI